MPESLLYHEIHGTTGPYLLMVHGIMSSRAQWIPNLENLSRFCRPVVVELFGHGRSPSPEDPNLYTPDNYVREFEAIRENLGIEEWFVCGQSLGAALTLRYSHHHPDRFKAHIFTNSRSALGGNPPQAAMQEMVKRLKKNGRKELDEFPLHPGRSRHLDPAIKKALVEDVGLIDLQGFANTFLYMIPETSVRELIRHNKVPTLLVVGKYDKQFMPFLPIAREEMPNLEVLILDGGHAVNIDAPEEFNRAVQDLITKHLNRRPKN